MQVIYLDNSPSMSVKKGAKTLLDAAKDEIRKQLLQTSNTKFLLITNDKLLSYQPTTAQKVLSQLATINISTASKTTNQILFSVNGLLQGGDIHDADVYFYSDFQKNNFPTQADAKQLEHIDFYGVPIIADKVQNIYIDTAFLTSPVLQNGQDNKLVIVTKRIGEAPKENPIIQLSINKQLKSAASLKLNEQRNTVDTLGFQVSATGWQKIALTINDASVRFDDTFRIAARSATNLSVLVLNEAQPSPYIQAAFKAYNGFKLDEKNIAEKADWKPYNLVILNGITHLDVALIAQVTTSLEAGKSICIFPNKTSNIAAFSDGINKITGVKVLSIDTTRQQVSMLQKENSLVKDVFERIPENVQLPLVNWHYRYNASLFANQQSIFSFRNGDPFLAQYTPSRGKLYLCASTADLMGSNFATSYFFVPFLYQMTIQSRGSDIFALSPDNPQPVYISMAQANERNVVHLYGNGVDVIPPQRPSGAGLDVFLNNVIHQSGYYSLAAQGGDTVRIAMNPNKTESVLEYWSLSELKNNWKGQHIYWIDVVHSTPFSTVSSGVNFPLWKVCVILALLMLAVETYLLASSHRKQIAAAK